MDFNSDDIKKIAQLARIKVDETENNTLRNELNNILHLVEEMNKADTQKVEPLAHPLDETQPLREDLVTEENERNLFQSIAPETDNGFYLVPPVIESE